MNSAQYKLVGELMEEFEAGDRPKFDVHYRSGDRWITWDDEESLRNAVTEDHPIRRHDPCRHLREAAAAGKRIRFLGTTGVWGEYANAENWAFHHKPSRYEIEPDWRLPDPPEGRQWNNAAKWTKEMLPDGCRPQLIGESVEGEWSDNDGRTWIRDKYPTRPIIRDGGSVIYRTNQPLPPPKKRVPLCQTDIPWNARLRGKGWNSGCSAPFSVFGFGVEFLWSGVKQLGWNELESYEYSTDGVTWHPFSKEVDA